MRGSWKIARLAGIDVSVHWSFMILLAYVVLATLGQGSGLAVAAIETGFVASAFLCVVLHELGHAMAARHYGICTRGITLLPIGGVASLERIPRKPSQELVITVAGPAVNLAIAALLFPILVAIAGIESVTALTVFGGQFLVRLFAFNVIMIVFNLLPAFPMDGGRILRAILALRQPYLRATEQAVTVGRVMAGLFVLAGLFWNPFLLLIALFVYAAGNGELQMLRQEQYFAQTGYAVPPWARSWPSSGPSPSGGAYSPGENLVVAELVDPSDADYQRNTPVRVIITDARGGPFYDESGAIIDR